MDHISILCHTLMVWGDICKSQSPLKKKENKQIVTSQSPKLQLSKKSKDASSSSKEEESPLKKNVKKTICHK